MYYSTPLKEAAERSFLWISYVWQKEIHIIKMQESMQSTKLPLCSFGVDG